MSITVNRFSTLITRKELASNLQLSEQTIVNLEQRGIVEGLKIGGSVRYNYGEVLQRIKDANARTRLKSKGD
jgi:DNA-binding XRE family transcriptional regulator